MWVTWTRLKTNSTGSSLPLTRFSYRGLSILSFQCFQTFFICYWNSCICVCTTSPRSPHLSQDGGGSIDVEEIRDIVVGLFRFSTILLKESSRLIKGFHWTKSFEYVPQTSYCSDTWSTKNKGPDSYFMLISALFILTRLAGIEEDEDLLTACVSDVRWVDMFLDTLTMLCKKFINIELGPQGRGGQGRGRGHLEGGVCEERDEQQVHPQHAQRLEQNFDDSEYIGPSRYTDMWGSVVKEILQHFVDLTSNLILPW